MESDVIWIFCLEFYNFYQLTHYCREGKNKICQFNFELTFNGLNCKGNAYLNAHYSVLWGFMD